MTFNFWCIYNYYLILYTTCNCHCIIFPFSVQCTSMVPPSGFSRYTCKSYFLYYPFELSLTACTSCALSFGFFLSYATKDSFIYSLQYGYGRREYIGCTCYICHTLLDYIKVLILWLHDSLQALHEYTTLVILIIKDILKHIWWDGNLFEYFFGSIWKSGQAVCGWMDVVLIWK